MTPAEGTDWYEDEDDGDDGGEQPRFARIPRDVMKRLEAKAKRVDEAEATAKQAARETMFFRAGLNPEDAAVKWFVKGYDGEESLDAIQAAAVEAGFLKSSNPTIDAELSEHQRVAASAAGSTPQGGDSETAYLSELALASNPAEAEQVMRKYGKPVAHGA